MLSTELPPRVCFSSSFLTLPSTYLLPAGQPIEIEFDYSRDRVPRAPTVATAAPGSLLSRLNPEFVFLASLLFPSTNPSLASSNANAPRGPRNNNAQPTSGRPARGRPDRGVGGAPSGPRGGRGRGGGGGRGEPRQKREPKTNDDLDAELEAFMKAPPAEGSVRFLSLLPFSPFSLELLPSVSSCSTLTNTSLAQAKPTEVAPPAPAAATAGDVEMS